MEMLSSLRTKSADPVPKVGMRMEMRPELKVTWWGILFCSRSWVLLECLRGGLEASVSSVTAPTRQPGCLVSLLIFRPR